jgi:formylglycine-generating enzyme required for sulfatase activity
VVNVNWYDAVQYANWVSQQMNLQPAYSIEALSDEGIQWPDQINNAQGYRLPTEAEWEFAASGGKKAKKRYIYSGSDDLDSVGWYAGNSNSRPQVVGRKKANDLEIVDMSGNVWEWCWDWYDGNYYANSENASNPRGPSTGSFRVLRGGGWSNNSRYCRAANRLYDDPSPRYLGIGFRLASSSR